MVDDTVFIISMPPKMCPMCGYIFTWTHEGQLDDFRAHAAHSCPYCGTRFQQVSGDTIKEAARKEGGDL